MSWSSLCSSSMQGGMRAHVKAETALYVSVFLLKVHGELQGSQASKAPGDKWDHGDVKGHLERKAGGEQKDHMAQRGPKETVARLVFLVFLVMMAHQATLEQAASLVCQEWMAAMGQGVDQAFLVLMVRMVSMGHRDYVDLKELKENLCMVLHIQGFRGSVVRMDNVVNLEEKATLGLKATLALLALLDLRAWKDLKV